MHIGNIDNIGWVEIFLTVLLPSWAERHHSPDYFIFSFSDIPKQLNYIYTLTSFDLAQPQSDSERGVLIFPWTYATFEIIILMNSLSLSLPAFRSV